MRFVFLLKSATYSFILVHHRCCCCCCFRLIEMYHLWFLSVEKYIRTYVCNMCIFFFIFFKLCRHHFIQFIGIWRERKKRTLKQLMNDWWKHRQIEIHFNRNTPTVDFDTHRSIVCAMCVCLYATLLKSIKIQNYQNTRFTIWKKKS